MRRSQTWALVLTAVFAIGLAFCSAAATHGDTYPGHMSPSKPAVPATNVFAPAIGICTSLDNAALAKSAGCDYIEEGVRSFLVPDRPDLEFQPKFALLKGSPLLIRACNGFLPETLKSVGPQARPDAIVAFAETAFRRGREAGVCYIVFGSSGSRGIPEGFDHAAARAQFIDLLKRLGPVAGKYGLVVALEPLRRAECNFINTVAEAAAIAREVDDPHCRLLADFYHMLCEDEGPASIVAAGPLLVHCHLAEEEGRTPPGVHGQDFTPYLEALRRIGYAGGISFEGRFSDLAKELPVAVKTLRAQIAKVSAAAGTQ
ncbi:MAG TPA: sugar phosphate isomerase/epimerase family protein [Acidobacteriota bacterium]|nr:sugar phosphate isomerase/epimerase family protein [Acidobacteriota bacterium]